MSRRRIAKAYKLQKPMHPSDIEPANAMCTASVYSPCYELHYTLPKKCRECFANVKNQREGYCSVDCYVEVRVIGNADTNGPKVQRRKGLPPMTCSEPDCQRVVIPGNGTRCSIHANGERPLVKVEVSVPGEEVKLACEYCM